MTKLLTSWILNAAALVFTAWLLGSHFELTGDTGMTERILSVALIALIFTIVNVYIAPIIKFLSLPFIIITLGIFLVIINALLLLFTEWFAGLFDLPLSIDGFWWAVLAALVLSIANSVLNALFNR